MVVKDIDVDESQEDEAVETQAGRAHAPVSPSKLKALEACPGFKDDNNSDPHPVTVEGSLVHDALETGEYDTLDANLKPLAQYCNTYAACLPSAGGGAVELEPKLEVVGGVFGYADRVQYCGKTADVLDWKMGWTPVEHARTNLQGWAYAVGVFNRRPVLEEVTVHFVQPRLHRITCHTFKRHEVPRMLERIRTVLASVQTAGPDDYRPVPENCQYCARYNCPKVAAAASKIASRYHKVKAEQEAAAAVLAGRKARPFDPLPDLGHPATIETPEQMAVALTIAPVLARWASSVQQAASRMRFDDGIEIPGYEVKYRSTPRKVEDVAAAWSVCSTRMGLGEFLETTTASLAKLEEKWSADAQRGKKAASKRELTDKLTDVNAVGETGSVPYLGKVRAKVDE